MYKLINKKYNLTTTAIKLGGDNKENNIRTYYDWN